MVCKDVKKLHKFIVKNKIDVTNMELIQVACKKCKDKDDCISIK